MGVPERPEDEDARSAWRQLAEVGNIGVFMVASVVIGLALGVALDRWTGHSPLFTLLLTVVGIVAGFREMFRILMKIDRKGAPKS